MGGRQAPATEETCCVSIPPWQFRQCFCTAKVLADICAAVQWLFLLEGAPAVLLGFLICW